MAGWFGCSRNAARGQHVKLVFPGGHVELLDRPTPAADVVARHPRFCVSRPDVFRDPEGAVAAPDTVLQLGHKYYVVPRSTVRRLLKYSAAGRSPGGGGAVTLKQHLSSSGGGCGHGKGYRVGGGRRWFRCLVGGGASNKAHAQRPREGAGHGGCSKDEVARKGDFGEISKENGKGLGEGSPGRRRRRGASPGHSASYSWQPSLHSITEE